MNERWTWQYKRNRSSGGFWLMKSVGTITWPVLSLSLVPPSFSSLPSHNEVGYSDKGNETTRDKRWRCCSCHQLECFMISLSHSLSLASSFHFDIHSLSERQRQRDGEEQSLARNRDARCAEWLSQLLYPPCVLFVSSLHENAYALSFFFYSSWNIRSFGLCPVFRLFYNV